MAGERGEARFDQGLNGSRRLLTPLRRWSHGLTIPRSDRLREERPSMFRRAEIERLGESAEELNPDLLVPSA